MDPNAEPEVYEGTAVNEMIMGGRYLKSIQSFEMMDMKMEGMNLEGYDNGKEEFTSVWIDSFGTGTSISKGKFNKEDGTIVYEGWSYDPMQKKDVMMKQIAKMLDDDTHFFEMFMVEGDKEFKVMEVTYTRK